MRYSLSAIKAQNYKSYFKFGGYYMDINQLKSMTIIQLRVLAKEKGVHSPTTLNKAQLVEKLAEKLNAEQPAEIQYSPAQNAANQNAAPMHEDFNAQPPVEQEPRVPSYESEDNQINGSIPSQQRYSSYSMPQHSYQPDRKSVV